MNYPDGRRSNLKIFSKSISNHHFLLSVVSKPLEHYFKDILESEAQCFLCLCLSPFKDCYSWKVYIAFHRVPFIWSSLELLRDPRSSYLAVKIEIPAALAGNILRSGWTFWVVFRIIARKSFSQNITIQIGITDLNRIFAAQWNQNS